MIMMMAATNESRWPAGELGGLGVRLCLSMQRNKKLPG